MGALLPGVKRHCMGRKLTIRIERAIDAMQHEQEALHGRRILPILAYLCGASLSSRPRGSRGSVGDFSIKHVAQRVW